MFSSLAASTPSMSFAPAATASEIQAAPANLASKPSSSTDMASTMAAASNSLMSGNHPNYGQRELI